MDRIDPAPNATAHRAELAQQRAAEQATPVDFDGYVLLLEIAGQAPSVYRFDRLPWDATAHSSAPWTCEDCGKDSAESVMRFYRTVPLHTHTGGEPDLATCQECTARTYWAKRLPDAQEDTVRDGSTYHMYNPNPTAYRRH